MDLSIKHRFDVPDVRLRVHSEMAVLRRPDGKTLLAAATYSNAAPTLVIATPQGEFRQFPLPGGKRGGGMVQSDADGNIICGARSLYRVNPEDGEVETLAADIIANDGIWGGGVTGKLIVVGSSTPERMLVVYDPAKKKVVKTFEPLHPEAGYVYHVVEAPDGRALVMSSLPRSVITLLDQETLEVEQCVPEALASLSNQHAGQFVGDDVFYVQSGNRAFLLRYPSFELLAEIPAPEGVTAFPNKSFVFDGRVGVWGVGTNMLYLLDAEETRWEPMLDEPVMPVEPEANERCSAIAALDDGSVCGISDRCVFFRVEKGARKAMTRQLDITGPVNCWGPWVVRDGSIAKAYCSSHVLQRFSEIDLDSGEGRDLGDSGPGGGQINDMLWDSVHKRLLMLSYASATIVSYDPAAPSNFPENPQVMARIGHGQMRPTQILAEGRAAWIITGAYYARLGGALSRFDMDGGELDVYVDPVGPLSPTRMLLAPEGGRLFLSTTIHGDCGSAIVTEKSAKLFVFDTRRREVLRAFAPREGAETLKLLNFDLDGNVLYLDSGELWRWDLAGEDVSRIGKAPSGIREVLSTPDRSELLATGHQGIGRLVPGEECRIEPMLPTELTRKAFDGLGKYLQWDGNTLWFTTGREVVGAELS